VIPTGFCSFFIFKSTADCQQNYISWVFILLQGKKKKFLWWFPSSLVNPVSLTTIYFDSRRTSSSMETLPDLWNDTWQYEYLQSPWDFSWISWFP